MSTTSPDGLDTPDASQPSLRITEVDVRPDRVEILHDEATATSADAAGSAGGHDVDHVAGITQIVGTALRTIAEAPHDDLDTVLDRVLGEVGAFCYVDRAYIYRFDDDRATLSNTHEWCSHGVEPQRDQLQGLDPDIADHWHEAFERDEQVYVPSTSSLDTGHPLRAALEPHGIETIIVSPLRTGGELLGFMGFDSTQHPSDLTAQDLEIMRILADTVANAIGRTRAEDRLRRVELVDPLTQLPNRIMFTELVEQTIAASRAAARVGGARDLDVSPGSADRRRSESDSTAMVGVIDLDQFVRVNEALGFAGADEVLTTIAAVLRQALRPEDHLARIGGDEFAVLIDGGIEDDAEAFAGRLVAAIAAPLQLGDTSLALTASVGICVDSGAFDNGSDLIAAAETALRDAKAQGGARAVAYDDELGAQLAHRFNLASALRSPGGLDGIRIAYQPAVHLPSGRIMGVEALARWDAPGNGPVSPDVFIPLIEETGLIAALTERVAQIVIEDVNDRFTPHLDGPFSVSINLSASHLAEPEFADSILSVLAPGELSEHVWLWGELTESGAMVNDPNVLANIVRLNERGIRVAIDDFGTGYSSFARLRHLPVAGIKIDRAFVSGVDADPIGQTLVRTQVAIAETLGMFIIAEGVETDAERLALMEQGVEFGQGFGLHRPMPAEQLVELLADNAPFPS